MKCSSCVEQKLREKCVLITTNSVLSGARSAHVTGFGVPDTAAARQRSNLNLNKRAIRKIMPV